MQSITPLVADDFRAKVQKMRYRFEIYVGAAWVDICALGSPAKNYLKRFTCDPSGPLATPDISAGRWNAEIYNADGIFHPFHPTSEYADYFRIGRKVRIAFGGVFKRFSAPLEAWPYRKLIALPIPTANLTNFPVEVPIIADADIGGACLANGHDIRFVALDEVTELPYERESFAVAGGEATGIFWVKSDVAMAGTYIWCYYGNAAADGDDHEAVWDVNYKLVAHMNDLTTSTIHDSTSNHNDGTKPAGANEPIEATGKIAKGQDFDGINDKIYFGNIDPASGDFTLEAWVNQTTDTGALFEKRGSPSGLRGYFLKPFEGLARTTLILVDSDDNDQHVFYFDYGVSPGTWVHVVVSVARANNLASLYLNGVFKQSIDISVVTSSLSGTFGLYMGWDLGSAYCDMTVDESRISFIVRSAEWIAYEYANMNPADGGLTWGAEESPQIPNYTKYWQRLIGYMDAPRFDHQSRTVSLSGCDYSKPLADNFLRNPTNFWGSSQTVSTEETTKTFGAEKYVEGDALLCQPPGDDLDVSPVGWGTYHGVFISEAETGGGSDFVGHLETSGDYGWTSADKSAGAIVNGKVYEIAFKYKRLINPPDDPGASLTLSLHNSATNEVITQVEGLASTSWTAIKFHFTAPCSCNTYWKLWIGPTIIDTPPYITVYWIDQLTFREVTARVNTRYVMPSTCNGVYAATLDGISYWYGDDNFGWFYDQTNKTFYFDDNLWLETGTDNLIISYFTTQDIMDVLGDVLAGTGLYADRAAALAALSYTDPGIDIGKAWFEAGTSALEAVRLICERCNYRFWFDYAGVPTFKPAPSAGAIDFDFEEYGDIKSPSDAQDLEQIRNRIVIEGIERAAFSTAKDKKTSRMVCADTHDQPSIDAYLEHTEPATNDLFQDQPSLDAMAAVILAERKDPKWYADLTVPFNPVPLEVGDTIRWHVNLYSVPMLDGGSFTAPGSSDIDGGTFLIPGETDIDGGTFLAGGVSVIVIGIIRSIGISMGTVTYHCEITDYE